MAIKPGATKPAALDPAAEAAEASQADETHALRGPETARLVALAQQGDAAAFERLISAYQSKIYGFARAYSSDPSEAADLAQEALIKVYRSLHGFRFQSSLLTWMFRIVKNVALDHYRSRQQRERRRELPIEGTSEAELTSSHGSRESAHGPLERLLADEQRQALWAALDHVPEVYRTVVVLADMQGLSYEEIAVIVGAPVGTVKSRLNRGRDALREVWLARNTAGVPSGKKERT
jgi:RNA polymerase sigma-70 factor, ECF subfamily